MKIAVAHVGINWRVCSFVSGVSEGLRLRNGMVRDPAFLGQASHAADDGALGPHFPDR